MSRVTRLSTPNAPRATTRAVKVGVDGRDGADAAVGEHVLESRDRAAQGAVVVTRAMGAGGDGARHGDVGPVTPGSARPSRRTGALVRDRRSGATAGERDSLALAVDSDGGRQGIQ